jgi:hypothetical protein
MRGALFWIASTALAFAVTATVFLVLAEIGTSPPERNLGAGAERPNRPGEPLSLELRQQALDGLKEAKDQKLGMTISNGSDRDLTNINVYLLLSSENTARPNTRYYEAAISKLAPAQSKRVTFDLDLSPPESGAAGKDSGDQESISIMEVRAASSEGASTVKTAVLSF